MEDQPDLIEPGEGNAWPVVAASLPAAPIRTFLVADIRGYTRFTEDRGDEAAARLAAVFSGLAREAVQAYGGQVTELRGDEALAVFESPRSALRAGVELQERCRRHSESKPDVPLSIGIGIDAGEALPVEDGYRGGALNLASRLCALAQGGEVLVSEGVVHLARHVDGLELADRGRARIKGMEQPVRVYEVGLESRLAKKPARFKSSSPRRAGERRASARITGIVGSSFGLAAFLLDLLTGVISTGRPLELGAAIAFCLIGFAGADLAIRRPLPAAFLSLGAAVGLAIVLTWLSVVAVVLLLITAGMSYFDREPAK